MQNSCLEAFPDTVKWWCYTETLCIGVWLYWVKVRTPYGSECSLFVYRGQHERAVQQEADSSADVSRRNGHILRSASQLQHTAVGLLDCGGQASRLVPAQGQYSTQLSRLQCCFKSKSTYGQQND
jgi:hypothetical protein